MDTHEAQKVLSLLVQLKADAAEVYFRSYTSTTVEVKDQRVDAFDRAQDIGAGLRALVDGRLGFAFTTDISPEALHRCAQAAVTNAVSAEPDPLNALPGKPDSYPASTIHDPALVNLAHDEMIARVMALEREAFAVDPRIKRIRKASASFSQADTLILNSHGAAVSYKSTACSSGIEVVAEENGEAQAGSDFDVKRFYRKLRFEEVGRKAAHRALDLLGAKRIASVKAPIVLEAPVAQEFLSMIASGLSAESVQKKRSLFINKIGTLVASPVVTILDDGHLEGGLGSAPSDDEAVPVTKKSVITEGTLKMFLHNTYTAARAGTASTGNGIRGGFKGLPGVGVTNLYIQPGTCTLEGLLDQAGRGLLVTDVMGMHTANPISGDFSVGATGFWIENGQKAYPVREITIAGNILEVMKNVDTVGCDLLFSGRIGSPSLLIRELSIGGK